MEGLIRDAVREGAARSTLPDPFPRMTYAEAMRRYGSDKPDLRIPLELVDVADLVAGCEFKVFAGPGEGSARPRRRAARAGRRRAVAQARSTTTPRIVARYGAKGLAYIKVNERAKGRDGLQSPILKFLQRCGGRRHPRAHRRRRTAT